MMKVKNKKGFTLTEIMVTIAIMIVLFGVGSIGAASIQRGLNQTNADAMARQIYITAQENLTKLKTSGNDSNVERGTKLEYEPIGADGYADNLYYLTNNSSGVSLLVPNGVLSIDYGNDSYVIEYDPDLGIVTGVFYGQCPDYDNYYDSDSANDLRELKGREDYYDENKVFVGYYGDGYTDASGNKNKEGLTADILIYNDDALNITFEVTSESSKVSKVNLDIVYFGTDSGATMIENIVGLGLTNGTATVTYQLDSLVPGQSFNDIFNTGNVPNNLKAGTRIGEQEFYPGENVQVSLVAYESGNTEMSSQPVVREFNSLFASSNNTESLEKTVNITYTRHLQNLNNCLNNIYPLRVVKAIQTGDIDITLPNGVNFEPIYNESLINYDGNNNAIKNLNVISKNDITYNGAGLFAAYGKLGSDSSINNLKLVNAKVLMPSVEYVGSLIGRTLGPVTLNNVGVYQVGDFRFGRAQDDVHIKGVNAGGLVGYATSGFATNRCFASTVITGNQLVGGLVAKAAQGAEFNLSYTDNYMGGTSSTNRATVGGLAGDADHCYIDSCYTMGFTMGNTKIAAGFAPNTIARKKGQFFSAYAGLKCTSASTVITTVKSVDGGLTNNDRLVYLNDILNTGTKVGKAVSGSELFDARKFESLLRDTSITQTFNFEMQANPNTELAYNYENLGLKAYPYPTIVGMEHHGDWEDSMFGDIAFFYWEYEKGGDQGYHYYLLKSNGELVSTLCEDHDDGGDITDYGYGYVIKSSEESHWDITWGKLSSGGWIENDTAASNGLLDVIDPGNGYIVYAYRTMDPNMQILNNSSQTLTDRFISLVNAATNNKYEFTTMLTEDGLSSLYLVGTARCASIEFKLKDSSTSHQYTFNPFFGKDISLGSIVDYYAGSIIDETAEDGPRTREIRSIEQLQFMNWNGWNMNCSTPTSIDQQALFPYLQSIGLNSATINYSTVKYRQTHDIDASGFDYTPIAALRDSTPTNVSGVSAFYLYNCFNSEYDGQSYLIKNLDIHKNYYTIGLFGTAVGAKFKNIIMLSDNGNNVIERLPDSSASATGDYFIGGLVGLAADDNFGLIDNNDVIENCAIGGYTILDNSKREGTSGSVSAVGGLAGYAGVTMEDCEAAVNIQINAQSEKGKLYVGGLVGSVNNGTNINDSVSNCYSGGKISFSDASKNSVTTASQNFYSVGGITGGNFQVRVANVSGNFNITAFPLKISDSYTYTELPGSNDDRIRYIGAVMGNVTGTFVSKSDISDCYYNTSAISGVGYKNYIEYNGETVIVNGKDTQNRADKELYWKPISIDGDGQNKLPGYTTAKMADAPVKANSAIKTYLCSANKIGNYPFDAKVSRTLNDSSIYYIHVGTFPGNPKTSNVTLSSGVSKQTGYATATITYNGSAIANNAIAPDMEISKLKVVNYPTFDNTQAPPYDNKKAPGYDSFLGYYYGDHKIVNADGTFVSDSVLVADGKWGHDETSITLTAKFNPIDYQIKLTAIDEATLDDDLTSPIIYNIEDNDFRLPLASKSAYIFLGWEEVKSSEDEGLSIPSTNVIIKQGTTGNKEYEAVWVEAPYTITYMNMAGAINSKFNPKVYRVSDSIQLEAATKSGYTFEGWYADPEFKERVTYIYEGTKGDLTLYAKWSVIKYQVTYNLNDGKNNDANPKEYTVDEPFTLSEPKKVGYRFIGWTGSNGDEPQVVVSIPRGTIGNLNYEAHWELDSYTITYELNGGYVEDNPTAFNVFSEDIILNNPTLTGYEFLGWTGSNGDTPELVISIPKGSEGDRHYIANWNKEVYHITYKLDGGTVSGNPETYYFDTDTFTLINPEKRGYEFIGWSGTDIVGTSKVVTIAKGETGDKEFTANWKIIEYTIEWTLNKGTYSGNRPATYTVEDEIALGTPTRKGYTFNGWFTKYDTTTKEYLNQITEIAKGTTGNLHLFAKWSATKYTITYKNKGDDNSMNPTRYYITSDTKVLKAPTRKGYTFDGWYLKYDSTTGEYSEPITEIKKGSTGNLIIYGKWNVIPYTITYHLPDGATNSESNPATYTIAQKITLKSATKLGYKFSGWYKEADFVNKVSKIYTGTTGDMDLYAKFSAIKYYITYELDGGKNSTSNPSYVYITSGDKTLKSPSKTGYTFNGWYTDPEFTDESKITVIPTGTHEAMTLYAKWTIKNYKITYKNIVSSDTNPNPKTYTVEDEIIFNEATRTDKSFVGWFTSSDGTVETYGINKGTTGDKTFYAKWGSKPYDITYELNGGTLHYPNKSTYASDTPTFTLNNPTKDGYDFAGWTGTGLSEPTMTVTITVGSTGERSYTATWTEATYTIDYELNGGIATGSNPKEYKISSASFTLSNPTRANYNFAGWTGSNGTVAQTTVKVETGSFGNRTYAANWTAKPYAISYNLNGGEVDEENPTSYTVETETFTLNNPEKDYYNFTGWTGSNGTTAQKEVKVLIGSSGDKSYTANFTPINYNITYDLNEGTLASANPTSYNIETNTITLNNPTRPGYTFAGWTGSNGNVAQTNVSIVKGSHGDKDYEANWTPAEYNISYDLKGGTVKNGTNPTSYNIETETFALYNPEKDYYNFAGWTGTGLTAATKTVTISEGSTGDRSYVATWSPKTYNITYDLKGGKLSTANPATYSIETTTFTLNNPTKVGYDFAGWTGSNGTVAQTSVTIAKGTHDNLSYTANWTPTNYTISYNLNGGEIEGTNPTNYNIETKSFTLINPTKDYYEFTGWTGTGLAGASKSVTIGVGSTGNRNYTANFTPEIYTITYDLDGGTVSGNRTSYTVETEGFKLNNPTRLGYVFAGWVGTDIPNTSKDVTIPKGSHDDREYTATWTALNITLVSSYYTQGSSPSVHSFDSNENKIADYSYGNHTAYLYTNKRIQRAHNLGIFDGTYYDIDGWYIIKDNQRIKIFNGDGTFISGQEANYQSNITVYPIWKALCNGNTWVEADEGYLRSNDNSLVNYLIVGLSPYTNWKKEVHYSAMTRASTKVLGYSVTQTDLNTDLAISTFRDVNYKEKRYITNYARSRNDGVGNISTYWTASGNYLKHVNSRFLGYSKTTKGYVSSETSSSYIRERVTDLYYANHQLTGKTANGSTDVGITIEDNKNFDVRTAALGSIVVYKEYVAGEAVLDYER